MAHSTSGFEVMAVSFTCFPKLPAEAKNMIWKFASLSASPRIVTVKLDKSQSNLIVRSSTPAVIHTSRDARAVALKHFNLLYQKQQAIKPFYVNFASDALFVETAGVLRILMSNPAQNDGEKVTFIQDKIQRLMLGGEIGNRGSWQYKLLLEMGKLQELKVQNQRGALDFGPAADMGSSWHKRLERGLQTSNKGLLVKWVPLAELKEAADNF